MERKDDLEHRKDERNVHECTSEPLQEYEYVVYESDHKAIFLQRFEILALILLFLQPISSKEPNKTDIHYLLFPTLSKQQRFCIPLNGRRFFIRHQIFQFGNLFLKTKDLNHESRD